MKRRPKKRFNLEIRKLDVSKPFSRLSKRTDTLGNISTYDISEAIDSAIRPTNDHTFNKWIADLFPVNYPHGHVVIEDRIDDESKYKLYEYRIENGIAILSSDFVELADTYTRKRFDFNIGKAEAWVCECVDCGHTLKTVEHCNTLKCSECGGEMRREARPGIGKSMDFQTINKKFEFTSSIIDETEDIAGIHFEKGEELRYVMGVVLEPETIDATKTDKSIGDIYSEEEVRKAAHHFMLNYSGAGNDFMHDNEESGLLKIVESYIVPIEMQLNGEIVKKGSWLMATLVLDDTIWDRIKKGEISGYSIGGVANGKLEAA